MYKNALSGSQMFLNGFNMLLANLVFSAPVDATYQKELEVCQLICVFSLPGQPLHSSNMISCLFFQIAMP